MSEDAKECTKLSHGSFWGVMARFFVWSILWFAREVMRSLFGRSSESAKVRFRAVGQNAGGSPQTQAFFLCMLSSPQ